VRRRWQLSWPMSACELVSTSQPSPVKDGFTPREREILSFVASGASNRDIAEALFISPKTVSVHVSALLRKFGVSGRGDLRTRAALNMPHERPILPA
jgi:DNA-binding NarL/FixJ family response regulator